MNRWQREREAMAAAHEEALARWDAMTAEERVERLKEIGILSPDGRLSGRYGGPGEWTEPPDPRFKWIPDDEEPATTPPRDEAAS